MPFCLSTRSLRALGLTLMIALGANGSPSAPTGVGPAPRRQDGRFSNTVGELSHSTLGVRLPFFLRRIAGVFSSRTGFSERVVNDGTALRATAASAATVTWIGHSTILVQMDGVTFLTDPTWSDTASPVQWAGPRRFVAPGIEIENLPEIDFVVVSHNHYDHLDLGTLIALAERNGRTQFFVPLENASLLRENGIDAVTEFDWGDTLAYQGIAIHCLPAQHWSKRSLTDDNQALWSSWAVIGATRRFYFAGDTGYSEHFANIGRALGPFDLAAVPIGAYEPVAMMQASHMNPEEAMIAAAELRARRALAMHFGTFDLSDEPLDEPPRRFLAAAALGPLGADNGWVLRIGQTREF